MKSQLIARRFANQHYVRLFNPKTGFFARIEEPGYTAPFWSAMGPELLDIAITNWCDRECAFCYRSSSRAGKHLSLEAYTNILQQAKGAGVLQIALGGGNPNQHPEFLEILRRTRQDYGIVPNYTTNGRGLTSDILLLSSEYCGAVAVSAYAPYEEMAEAIDLLSRAGCRTNVHFLLDADTIHMAMRWLTNPPGFLRHVNALIFLSYKPLGRQVHSDLLLCNSPLLPAFFALTTKSKRPFRIGFDSCSATGLCRYTKVPRICYDGCDAGRFSMFASEKSILFPCSFMADAGYEGIPLSHDNMQSAWQSGALFVEFRKCIRESYHSSCDGTPTCPTACPVFPEIDLCTKHRS